MNDLSEKYRPIHLSEVVGQDVNIEILRTKLSNPYQTMIFYGSSGCGKTTTARALATDLDAEIIELDAASNNSVDDVRQLLEVVGRVSLTKAYKVIVIDECHMLSKAAWNAALKTIEVPPHNVVFIFCTTEYRLIPLTIRGRSQLFKFYRLPGDVLETHLNTITDKEGLPRLSQNVIQEIIKRSNNQARDAIKLLQTCLENGITDLQKLNRLLAIPSQSGIGSFIDAVLAGDPRRALAVVSRVETELVEWVRQVEKLIYEILFDAVGIEPLSSSLATATKLQKIYTDHGARRIGLLLDELNTIQSAEQAYARLVILATKGV